MSNRPLCHLCETRAPRRFCPALRSEICAPCCGTEREQTIECPLDCEHLREARRHEKLPPVDAAAFPHPEIEITDRFLGERQELAVACGRIFLVSALNTPGCVDADVRDALDSLTRTYKTLQSGLVYETHPANTIAAAVQERFQGEIGQLREMVAQRSGAHTILDSDILGVLVFWQRVERQRSNGRRKGRAFIESLYSLLPAPAPESGAPETPTILAP